MLLPKSMGRIPEIYRAQKTERPGLGSTGWAYGLGFTGLKESALGFLGIGKRWDLKVRLPSASQ